MMGRRNMEHLWAQSQHWLESEVELGNDLAAIFMATSFLALVLWLLSYLPRQAIATIWLGLNISAFIMIVRHYMYSPISENVIQEILDNVVD